MKDHIMKVIYMKIFNISKILLSFILILFLFNKVYATESIDIKKYEERLSRQNINNILVEDVSFNYLFDEINISDIKNNLSLNIKKETELFTNFAYFERLYNGDFELGYTGWHYYRLDRKSTRLNSSHT